MSRAAQAQRARRILFRAQAALGGAATVNQSKVRLLGMRRLVGHYHLAPGMAAAAGFPRLRFSGDGVVWDVVRVLVADPAQAPEVVYPIDHPIEAQYVAVELTNGAVAGLASAQVSAVPEG